MPCHAALVNLAAECTSQATLSAEFAAPQPGSALHPAIELKSDSVGRDGEMGFCMTRSL